MSVIESIKWIIESRATKHKDLHEETKKDFKILRNDIKDTIKNENPFLGNVIETTDRIGKSIANVFMPVPKKQKISKKARVLYKKLELEYDVLDLSRGDHIVVRRGVYTHHGIYLGDQKVIHYRNKGVKVEDIKVFKKYCRVFKVLIRKENSPLLYPIETVINRAMERINENEYNLITNNCDHFANWCRNGSEKSKGI
ncbi:lecithin retinol acyltransferase family protein [Bacillus sp. EAC]|uniref:lecithin retinol acyltransferase family protein n=1 Tax=Bacillus sp. EAC TaxID=1978338 RepID=UPI000B431B96|nr:lecithin retinol acyltransferase family protein [Bacillus sp. EAC]